MNLFYTLLLVWLLESMAATVYFTVRGELRRFQGYDDYRTVTEDFIAGPVYLVCLALSIAITHVVIKIFCPDAG